MFLITLVGALLFACGTAEDVRVNTDEESVTTYETRTIRLSDVRGFSGLTKPKFDVYVRGQCTAPGCPPKVYDLVFRTDPGASRIRLEASDVELIAGDERLFWDDPFRQAEGRTFEARGTIVSVECTLDALKTLTAGDDVRGNLGGISFRIYSKNMDPIRRLIQRVDA
jgi:hypothetical protein